MQNGKIDSVLARLDLFIEESRAARARQDEDMREIRASLASMGKHVQNLSVTAMVGVGGMFIAVGVMVGTMIYAILTR